MPDADGNFKGISIKSVPWHEVKDDGPLTKRKLEDAIAVTGSRLAAGPFGTLPHQDSDREENDERRTERA